MPYKLKGPWRITFDTNPDDCNLHCIMCEEHSSFKKSIFDRTNKDSPRRMDFTLIKQVIMEANNYGLREIIPSTMGEPLLYQNFEKIIEICHKFGLKLNLTTNGTFPRRSTREWALLIVPVANDVKISWNGATAETSDFIMQRSNFYAKLQNVSEFIGIRDEIASKGLNRCRITFQVTFMESNFEELPDIIKLAAELSVDRVKGHHIWVHCKEMEDQSMRRNEKSIKRWNDMVKLLEETAEKYRLPSGEKVLLDNIFPLTFGADELIPDAVCPFLGQETWIATDGSFNPCCAPDNLRRTLGDFGNLYERTLMEIWNSPAYEYLCKNYLNYQVCKSCNMRRPPLQRRSC